MTRVDHDKFEVRVMKQDDLQAIIGIDARVTGEERVEYYEEKIAHMFEKKGEITASLVAEEHGHVIGFIMGKIYMGEFGIPGSTASLDTIGIDPDYAGAGLGTLLLDEFVTNVKAADVTNIQTLVDWNDVRLLRFFNKNGFIPSKTINLEKSI
jgi:ribosomal protein S18 acetylase RimI-like enzyme